nr:hypothetical protein [Rhizobium setariae]
MPALRRLETGDVDAAWKELWNNLHHQGDVGTASYAAVPEIVRIAVELDFRDWNAYALVATIDECRLDDGNPELSPSAGMPYFAALTKLAEKGASEILASDDALLTRSILAVLAFAKGASHVGSFALLATDEQEELLAI